MFLILDILSLKSLNISVTIAASGLSTLLAVVTPSKLSNPSNFLSAASFPISTTLLSFLFLTRISFANLTSSLNNLSISFVKLYPDFCKYIFDLAGVQSFPFFVKTPVVALCAALVIDPAAAFILRGKILKFEKGLSFTEPK